MSGNGFPFESLRQPESAKEKSTRMALMEATDDYHQLKKDIRDLVDGINHVVSAKCWDIAVDLANELNNKSVELAPQIRAVQEAYDAYVPDATA